MPRRNPFNLRESLKGHRISMYMCGSNIVSSYKLPVPIHNMESLLSSKHLRHAMHAEGTLCSAGAK